MASDPVSAPVPPSEPNSMPNDAYELATGLVCGAKYIEDPESPTSNGTSGSSNTSSETETPFLAMKKNTNWPDGYRLKIKFVQKPIGTEKEVSDTIQKMKNAASEWEKLTSLNFIWMPDNADSKEADIRIAFQAKDEQGVSKGNTSYIGREALLDDAKRDACTMNFEHITVKSPDNLIRRLVLHEFGHALGCVHEHQSPASQQLNWNTKAVEAYYNDPPNKWGPDRVKANIYDRYNAMEITNSEFDPDSIMLYEFPANFFFGGKPTKNNITLSAGDKAFIQKMYPKQYSRSAGQAQFVSATGHAHVKPVSAALPPSTSDTSTTVTFDAPYTYPPNIAMGISTLAMERSSDYKINVAAEKVTEEGFRYQISGNGVSELHAVGATWLEIDPNAIDIQSGQVTLGSTKGNRRAEKLVRFPRKFSGNPKILLWISGFDAPIHSAKPSASEKDWAFELSLWAWDKTNASFLLTVHTGYCYTESTTVTWIAIDSDIEGVACGLIREPETGRSQGGAGEEPFKQVRGGRIAFPKDTFDSPPKVFLAPSTLEWEKDKDLQFVCGATDITEEDFEYSFETWDDSNFTRAEMMWIAVS